MEGLRYYNDRLIKDQKEHITKITKKAVKNVNNLEKFGKGDPRGLKTGGNKNSAGGKYKIFFNDCKEKVNGLKSNNKFIKFLLILLLLSGCVSPKKEVVMNDDAERIQSYIQDFYTRFNAANFKEISECFIKNKPYIDYREMLYSEEEISIFLHSEEDLKLLKSTLLKNGAYLSFDIKDISFEKNIYDVSESDLYCITIEKNYSEKSLEEILWLKLIDNNIYIYRYFIFDINEQ